MIAATHVSVSIGGLILGLLLGLLVYIVGVFLARRTGEGLIATVCAIIGVIIFFVMAFDIWST